MNVLGSQATIECVLSLKNVLKMCSLTKKCVLLPYLYAVLERKFKKGVLEFAYNILDGVEFVSQRAVPEIKLRVV